MCTARRLICAECREEFIFDPEQLRLIGLVVEADEQPKKCPACLNNMPRPYEVIRRREVFAAICSASTVLPDLVWKKWTVLKSGRRSKVWRARLTGAMLGSNWSGSMDIWWYCSRPPMQEQIISLRVMEVNKRVRLRHWIRQTPNGSKSGWHRVPLSDVDGCDIPGFSSPGQTNKTIPDRIEIATDTYLRLRPSAPMASATHELVMPTATHKKLGKGQYCQRIIGAPCWGFRFTGCPEPRVLHKTVYLAVVDTNHPLSLVQFENGGRRVVAEYPTEQFK